MIKKYTPQYMNSRRGCYSSDKMASLVNGKDLTIQDFLNWDIPIKDKFYFVRCYTELTLPQKKRLSLNCAKVALPIYEAKYKDDNRVRNCIGATEKFLNGEISREELKAAYDAAAYAAAAAAAYAAVYAAADADDAYAAVYAAAYADDAYAAADAAAAAAAYADDAYAAADAAAAAAAYAAAAAAYAYADDGKSDYTNQLLDMLKQFCNEQEETF